ncbi:MAG: hypothetical protein LJE65_12920, partial [Desulfobacteraceae bacterium]|nr:hypothetical protein [Desulfobacteraceae bacterium]
FLLGDPRIQRYPILSFPVPGPLPHEPPLVLEGIFVVYDIFCGSGKATAKIEPILRLSVHPFPRRYAHRRVAEILNLTIWYYLFLLNCIIGITKGADE